MLAKDAINKNCPWSGKAIQDDSLTEYHGKTIGFCNPGCRDKFAANPLNYPEVIALIDAAE